MAITTPSTNVFDVRLPAPVPKPTSLEGDVHEASEVVWLSADGRVEVGVWQATPGTFAATRPGYHETACVVQGTGLVIHDSGDTVVLEPGVCVVTPEGWTGRWIIHETLRKSYVISKIGATPDGPAVDDSSWI